MEGLPTPRRRSIWRRLREIAEAPDRFEDFQERDVTGREPAGHIFEGFAILYWDDLADRHLKGWKSPAPMNFKTDERARQFDFSTAMNASCGMFTRPMLFIRFLPSFCFSRSLRLREMSPP